MVKEERYQCYSKRDWKANRKGMYERLIDLEVLKVEAEEEESREAESKISINCTLVLYKPQPHIKICIKLVPVLKRFSC